MNRQFRSDNPRRLQLLRDQKPVGKNGIDFVEITSVDQRSLRVVCVHPVIAINRANVRIEGGVRVTGIVLAAEPVLNGREIHLKVDQAGDFSWYTLSLIDPADKDAPAPGFDICLSTIRINFKAGCPSEFDCAEVHDCPPLTPPEPRPDYLAKQLRDFREGRRKAEPMNEMAQDLTDAQIAGLAAWFGRRARVSRGWVDGAVAAAGRYV